MQKYLVFAYLVGSLAACRNDGNTGKDLGVDMAAPPGSDLSANSTDMAYNYTAGTIHDVDTSGPTGPYSAKKPVTLTDVIATTIVRFFQSSDKKTCTYEVFVQQATCATPPCGLVLHTQAPSKADKTCDKAAAVGGVLANVKQGDKLTVNGVVDIFQRTDGADGGAPVTWAQHSMDAKDVTVTASMQTLPTAVDIADPSIFTTNGSGWAMYEGMLVKISNVTIATGADKFGNFTTSPGGAKWGGAFDFLYRFTLGSDAGDAPMAGMTYSSITGVVATVFQGSINATGAADFKQ